MIRTDDTIDGRMADLIAHSVEEDAKISFFYARAASLAENGGRPLHPRSAALQDIMIKSDRDNASFFWDMALIGDWERGAMP